MKQAGAAGATDFTIYRGTHVRLIIYSVFNTIRNPQGNAGKYKTRKDKETGGKGKGVWVIKKTCGGAEKSARIEEDGYNNLIGTKSSSSASDIKLKVKAKTKAEDCFLWQGSFDKWEKPRSGQPGKEKDENDRGGHCGLLVVVADDFWKSLTLNGAGSRASRRLLQGTKSTSYNTTACSSHDGGSRSMEYWQNY